MDHTSNLMGEAQTPIINSGQNIHTSHQNPNKFQIELPVLEKSTLCNIPNIISIFPANYRATCSSLQQFVMKNVGLSINNWMIDFGVTHLDRSSKMYGGKTSIATEKKLVSVIIENGFKIEGILEAVGLQMRCVSSTLVLDVACWFSQLYSWPLSLAYSFGGDNLEGYNAMNTRAIILYLLEANIVEHMEAMVPEIIMEAMIRVICIQSKSGGHDSSSVGHLSREVKLIELLVGVGWRCGSRLIQLINILILLNSPIVHEWDPGGIQQRRKGRIGVQLCETRNFACNMSTNLLNSALFLIINTIAKGRYDTSNYPSKHLALIGEILLAGGAIFRPHLHFLIEEISTYLELIQDQGKGVEYQAWSHINPSVYNESEISKEAIDLLNEWLMCFDGDLTRNIVIKPHESQDKEEEGISGFVKFGGHKLMIEHLIHGLESSRVAMAERHHKQWDPGEPYLASCIIRTSCFKLWDPGGRPSSLLLSRYLHLEDKVNFEGGSIDENLGMAELGQTNRFGRVYSRRGKKGNCVTTLLSQQVERVRVAAHIVGVSIIE